MNLQSCALVLIGIGFTFGASTGSDGEKREMPSGYAYNMYRTGGDTTQIGSGGYTTTLVGQGQGQGLAYTTLMASDRQGQPMPSGINVAFGPSAPAQYGNGAPPHSPYSFKDPGFSVQTGFEGFLVPNPWYGAITWGLETFVVAGLGIAFVLALGGGAIFLLFKIARFGKFFKDGEGGEGEVGARSYIPSVFNQENLSRLTTSVMDALEKYNQLILEGDKE